MENLSLFFIIAESYGPMNKWCEHETRERQFENT